jgi:hypothetical protein
MHEPVTVATEEVSPAGRTQCETRCILSRTKIVEMDCCAVSAIFEVPADVEYHGHRIVWDTRRVEGTSLWTGRAAIVAPADLSGIKGVQKIKVNRNFSSEKEVRDYLIAAAKNQIDTGFEL